MSAMLCIGDNNYGCQKTKRTFSSNMAGNAPLDCTFARNNSNPYQAAAQQYCTSFGMGVSRYSQVGASVSGG